MEENNISTSTSTSTTAVTATVPTSSSSLSSPSPSSLNFPSSAVDWYNDDDEDYSKTQVISSIAPPYHTPEELGQWKKRGDYNNRYDNNNNNNNNYNEDSQGNFYCTL